jgi:hypothetical protein
MNDYTIIYRSVGAGLQTWDRNASSKDDAIEQFVDTGRNYNGNCYAKNSIVSVYLTEDLAKIESDANYSVGTMITMDDDEQFEVLESDDQELPTKMVASRMVDGEIYDLKLRSRDTFSKPASDAQRIL